ncbi:MAG: efflux RND transporter periplasmic adaptor subunit [Acidobacteria bacterium]|nr:efflux RND transporter periplasmic adaptor subunit [Acidobacteriota bacterium]
MFGQQEEKTEKKSRKKILITLVVVLILTVSASVILSLNGNADPAADAGEEADKDEKAPVPVEVVEARSGEISSYITATANLTAENEVQVIAESEGLVSRYHYQEGQRVSRGAVLATLVSDEQQILLDKSRARAENARAAHERARELWNAELISKTEFETTVMERRVTDQELAEAQYRLSKTTIRAPITGVVTVRQVQLGQHLRPGDQLYTITDFDPLIADIYLPERETMLLSPGREVRLVPKADPSLRFPGRIRMISPVVDRQTGTVKVTVETSGVPDAVRPGSFVEVNIVKQTRPDSILVPRESVIRELGNAHLFVAKNGKAFKREVKLGIEEGEIVEIVEGIEAGEKVIVAGQGGLKDEAPVKILSDAA